MFDFIPQEYERLVNIIFGEEYSGEELCAGDINGDDGVNVLDVLSLVNSFFDDYYLSQDQIWSGDMTSDNILDITDIVFLVNFIFVH